MNDNSLNNSSTEKTKEFIEGILKSVGWMTYPQLLNYLKKNSLAVDGSYQIRDESRNITFWSDVSSEVATAMVELLNEGSVVHLIAPAGLYELENVEINYPIVDSSDLDKRTPESEDSLFLSVLAYMKNDYLVH